MSNVNDIVDPPLPVKLAEGTLVLTKKTLIRGDPDENLEDFYAYDFESSESGMVGSIDMYVAVNRQSTSEFNELQVGQKFKLVPSK